MNQPLLLGIEIGGTKLQAALGDSCGRIAHLSQTSANPEGGATAIINQLEEMIEKLLKSREDPPAGSGIGFGGPINALQGTVTKSNHVAGWDNFPLKKWAETTFGIPCMIGNDTDVAALAEARVASRKDDHCVFYTNIGSGIGGGLVFDGKLYERSGGAMEVGHTRVYSSRQQRHGILEDFCSGWSLNACARDAARQDTNSALWQKAEKVEDIDARHLFAAWQAGDIRATEVVDDFLDCYARAMSNIIAVLNPDVIVIGGGLSRVGQPLLNAIRERIRPLVYAPFKDSTRIELTHYGDEVVPVGAILLAAENLEHR